MPRLCRVMVWTCLCVVLAMTSQAAAQGTTINVPAGGDLQAAIDAAAPGDTILLTAGATYTGNFVLRAKPGTTFVTIRTAVDPRQPPDGVRVGPGHSPALARLQSANSLPALRTAGAAHHYRLLLLELGANPNGYGEIVQLGQADSTQTDLTQVPYSLVLDRLYIHGDPLLGQKRGISLNSGDTQILNCYISDIKAVGQDTQAIAALNGPGPYLIQNNYLEAAAENFLTGGVDPTIPGLTPSDITFRYNYLSKPVAWKDPIVPMPDRVTAVAGAGGTLAAGTYAYRVVAQRLAGQTTTARSSPSAEVTATVASAGAVSITWAVVPNATSYRVYGRAAGAENQYWTTTGPAFTDTGTAGTAGTAAAGTVWTVKNLFELKNAQRVLAERNVMENNWQGGQSGYAIVLTPRNSGGLCTWCAVQNVTLRLNLVRHTAAGINILGYDNGYPSGQARDITISDNLFYDVNKTTWGGNGWGIQMGDGPANIVLDHNTIDYNGTSVVYAYGTLAITGFQFTNHLTRHNSYGIMGAGTSPGNGTITQYFPGSNITWNVLADGSASKYPAGNFFPTLAYLMAQFVDPANGNYALVAGSPYKGGASDGDDLGANTTEIASAAAIALSGDSRSGGSPLQIVTTSLPTGTVGQSFSAGVAASGGSGSYSWSETGGLPAGVQFDPSQATFAGTPTQYGAWAVTVTVHDTTSSTNSASATFTLTVRPTQVQILTTTLATWTMGKSGAATLQATGGTGTCVWRIVSGALPPGVALDGQSGTIFGTPTSVGTFTFLVEAADVVYSDDFAQSSESLTVTPPPVSIVTTTLPSGVQGTSYSTTVLATGGAGPLAWSIVSGALPAGLLLDAATGTISGTPSSTGSSTFTIRASDSLYPSNSASASLNITIASAPLVIITTTIPDARRTIYYSTQLQATGGTSPLTWRLIAGSLPAGMTLSTDGIISGKSGYYGYWTFTVEVRDSATPNAVATRQYTLTVRTKDGRKPPAP